MAIKKDFDPIIDWSRTTEPTDPPGTRRAIIASVTRYDGSVDLKTEWIGQVEYLDHQVHTVVGRFHGDLGANMSPSPDGNRVPPIGGSHLDYWLSLTAKEEWGCWLGIANAGQVPELGGAWVEDVLIDNLSPWAKPPPPTNAELQSRFEVHADPSSNKYLILDLSGHFVV